jgi:serine protease Do
MTQIALVLDESESKLAAVAAPVPANDARSSDEAPKDEELLDAYSRAVVQVVERVGPAVVSIGRSSRRGPAGAGSGVVFTPDGYVLTNAHVAAGAHQLELGFTDGSTCAAQLVGVDHATDLAVVRASGPTLAHAPFGSSASLRVGQLVIAIGNPLGFVGALTTGVVHAVGPLRGLGPQSWIQANVRLAPGNSGGPLADAEGGVVGINTMVAGGLGLAIPSRVVQDFLATGPAEAWMGATVQPVRLPRSGARGQARQAFGILLTAVEARSPAAAASLRPGDIVLGTERARFSSIRDLARELHGTSPRLLRLEFLRGDYARVRRVTLQLGDARASRSAAAA